MTLDGGRGVSTPVDPVHSVYFIPGMFGFGELAGYDYFHHMREGLEARYEALGARARFADVPTPPTASIRERARILAKTIAAGPAQGPIHLIGHSTGGLDARLALSPSSDLGLPLEQTAWTQRVQTVTTICSPHYGTPLASYFTTFSGARLLYALSFLTVVALRFGEPFLAIPSRLVRRMGSLKEFATEGDDVFRRVTSLTLRFVDRDTRRDIKAYLRDIKVDQGAFTQISPENMNLFNVSVEDAEHVRYGSLIAATPTPSVRRGLRRVRTPYSAVTAVLFGTLHKLAARHHSRYGYAPMDASTSQLVMDGFGQILTARDSDGVVPTLSMPWGEVLWAGAGDHLDVLGHFRDDGSPALHMDWMSSGSAFTRERFRGLLDAVVEFQLASGVTVIHEPSPFPPDPKMYN
jgi:hypothetical protein